jgi:hypothetical protein
MRFQAPNQDDPIIRRVKQELEYASKPHVIATVEAQEAPVEKSIWSEAFGWMNVFAFFQNGDQKGPGPTLDSPLPENVWDDNGPIPEAPKSILKGSESYIRGRSNSRTSDAGTRSRSGSNASVTIQTNRKSSPARSTTSRASKS